MTRPLFLLPYSGDKPYYLADAPAGRDAGSSVDFKWRIVTGPNGSRDITSLIRQAGLTIRGEGVIEVKIYVDGALSETHKVYVQPTDPTAALEGEWWLDTSASPVILRRRISRLVT